MDVRVKPLEWSKVPGATTSEAPTGFGSHYIVYSSGPTWWSWGIPGQGVEGTSYKTEDEAKAAAQTDYASRILSAIAAAS
jgi:hypothetical protein